MKHFGDITKISGYSLPIVDVITGGSPCQDLSVAGKRKGMSKTCPNCGYSAVGNDDTDICPKCGESLEYTRSGLFMEQIRIVKEMREHDRLENGRPVHLCRPRFMVWENVGGAYSSGTPKGADFQAVLQEITRIVCKEAPAVPIPQDGWPKSGCISGVGDSGCTFSVCWRLHDAQFWGVPQRRKRIALVADFGGLAAPEVLFERKGLHWYPEPSGEAWEGTAEGTESGADRTICLQGNGIDRADTAGCNGAGWRRGGSYTLNTIDRPAVMAVDCRNGTENECINGTLQAKEQGSSLNLNNVVRTAKP